MPGPDSNNDENRAARRQRVLKQGKILPPADLVGVDCTVRDISESGARLLCADPTRIPDEFRLVFQADRTMRDVRVMWRRDGQIGVQFTSEPRRAPLLKW